jgi:hypothetical protein
MLSRFVSAPFLAASLLLGGCGTSPPGGPAADGGADATPPDDASDATAPGADAGSQSALTGTLGALGAVQPIVSSWVISNSGETLVYLSTAPLTCDTLQASRWLGTQPAGSQVVEIVMRGTPTPGQTVAVPPGEVNYAGGGRSSSYEVNAASGSINYMQATANGPVTGMVQATYRDGSMIMGTFHADFCANGQNY